MGSHFFIKIDVFSISINSAKLDRGYGYGIHGSLSFQVFILGVSVMTTVLDLAIVSVFDSLKAFSNQDNIWDLLAIPFGENYDRARAGALREQWQTGVDVEMPASLGLAQARL